MFEVSSEIYRETNFQPVKGDAADGKVVSKFKFLHPDDDELNRSTIDIDGDLVVRRKSVASTAAIEIEHSEATVIKLVGLQVWRGALLLADYCFHKRRELQDKQVLELGAGVGLTSIAAAFYARRVVCTDVDMGGILDLIRRNVKRNSSKFSQRSEVEVMEYDFMQAPTDYSVALQQVIDESDIIVAADVIYDDELTDAFIRVLDTLFASEQRAGGKSKKKEIYVALEKRYVFTLSECDSVAPMFEYFLKQTMKKTWHFEYISMDFPQYFEYDRCKQLVLIKLSSR